MSQRGIDFMENWLSENIELGAYAEEGKPDDRVPPLVAKCLADAKAAGVSRKEIEDDMFALEDCIGQALKSATNAEVDRLASKDN